MSLAIVVLAALGSWQSGGSCRGQQLGVEAEVRAPDFVDPGWLLSVEDRVLPPAILPGPAAHEDLPAYYAASNPALVRRFQEAREAYESSVAGPYRRLTYVAGDAGIGKTFLKGQVFSKRYPPGEVLKFDICELYRQWQAEGLTELRADLHDGDLVLNHLPAVRDHARPLVSEYLAAHPTSFYVIDSLDEIHPDDHAWLLDQVENFVFASERPFVHLVVFGRPLAFRDHWQRRSAADARDRELLVLAPPRFRTTGDLLVSCWNYLAWKHNLRWQPDGGEPRGMTADEFARWARGGFSRFDEFGSVVLDGDSAFTTRVHQTLVEWSGQHRVVGPPLYNLAGNSLLRGIVEGCWHEQAGARGQAGPRFDERGVMDRYLQAWLKRDTNSDDRPSLAKPEFLDVYIQLLERVAAKYLRERRIAGDGYFNVSPSDQIQLSHDGRQLSFPVASILDRSGLVRLELQRPGVPRYRFEPIWLHRLLVEMHNERLMSRSFTRSGS